MAYLLTKTAHLVFVMAWMGGVFYLPRILVNIAEAGNEPAVHARLMAVHEEIRWLARRPGVSASQARAWCTCDGRKPEAADPSLQRQGFMHGDGGGAGRRVEAGAFPAHPGRPTSASIPSTCARISDRESPPRISRGSRRFSPTVRQGKSRSRCGI